jgi:hypothetical protein
VDAFVEPLGDTRSARTVLRHCRRPSRRALDAATRPSDRGDGAGLAVDRSDQHACGERRNRGAPPPRPRGDRRVLDDEARAVHGVEHAIARLKNWRILRDHRRRGCHLVYTLFLHNLQLEKLRDSS